MHRVQPRREPGRDLVAAQLGRQIGHRHQAAVGQVATEDRRAIGQQLATHPAPEAVAAQQRASLVTAAVLGLQPDAVRILLESLQALAQPAIDLAAALQLAQQDLVQVGAVDGRVGLAVALLHRGTQCQAAKLGARAGVAHGQALGKCRHLAQRRQQAPVMQHAHRVGAELDAGSDLGEGLGLLEQCHLQPGTLRHQGRAQARHAATDHQQIIHGPIVPDRDWGPSAAGFSATPASRAASAAWRSRRRRRQSAWPGAKPRSRAGCSRRCPRP